MLEHGLTSGGRVTSADRPEQGDVAGGVARLLALGLAPDQRILVAGSQRVDGTGGHEWPDQPFEMACEKRFVGDFPDLAVDSGIPFDPRRKLLRRPGREASMLEQ